MTDISHIMPTIVRLLLLTLVLVACGPPLTAGNVTDKQFIAEHLENYTATEYGCGYGYDPINNDYSFGCGRMVQVTRQRTVPDQWTITIEGCENGENCRSRTLQVPQEVFDKTKLGSYYYTGESVD